MSALMTEEYLKILDSYLKANFYINLNYDDPEIIIYYNTISNDLLSCVRSEKEEKISKINLISDYITLVAESNNRIESQNDNTGIIYIDQSPNALKESIIIAKVPKLREIVPNKRREFASQFSSINILTPFWISKNENKLEPMKTANFDGKTLDKGKKLIETAINNYCNKNDVPRENISNLDSFFDHLLPDIFKYKITVSDEQEIHKEINNFDKHYPEVFIQSLYKMGYLE